ncbi:enoyl-CoA hydratase/isomerase family protein [Patulibacter sp. S7RM1-6]
MSDDAVPRVALELLDEEGIGIVHLRAAPENTLSPDLLDELTRAVDRFAAGPGRVLVVASDVPGAFARGGDLEHLTRCDASGFVHYMHAMRAAFDRLDGLDAPSIAAVDGDATGGGLELALACTFRVAAADARMGLPQVKLGFIPGAGGTQRLPRVVGRGKALDLLVTGRSIDADEAYALGLTDRRAPAGGALDVALELASDIARASGPALRALRRATAAAGATTFPQGMAVEAREALALFEHGDARDGFAAYLEDPRPGVA